MKCSMLLGDNLIKRKHRVKRAKLEAKQKKNLINFYTRRVGKCFSIKGDETNNTE